MDAATAATASVPAMAALAAVVLGAAAWVGATPWRTRWRRRRIAARPFPAPWRQILRRRVPMVARLPVPAQQRLKRLVQVFIAEKPFIGCQGQAIDDEVRVTIAAQAALLLLGQARDDVYPALRQVLVYPAGFVVARVQQAPGGVQHEGPQVMSGESWQQGQVVLSWPDVLAGAADPDDGENVVLHEFAHQIDQDKGEADGQPWRPTRAARRRWRTVIDQTLAALRQQQSWRAQRASEAAAWARSLAAGVMPPGPAPAPMPPDVLGDYAAQSPAELLAVATERFFERPDALAVAWPALYAELQALYRLDPRAWERPPAAG
jgi:Mlc titration factor MtfA (ptsG expression regulator)